VRRWEVRGLPQISRIPGIPIVIQFMCIAVSRRCTRFFFLRFFLPPSSGEKNAPRCSRVLLYVYVRREGCPKTSFATRTPRRAAGRLQRDIGVRSRCAIHVQPFSGFPDQESMFVYGNESNQRNVWTRSF